MQISCRQASYFAIKAFDICARISYSRDRLQGVLHGNRDAREGVEEDADREQNNEESQIGPVRYLPFLGGDAGDAPVLQHDADFGEEDGEEEEREMDVEELDGTTLDQFCDGPAMHWTSSGAVESSSSPGVWS